MYWMSLQRGAHMNKDANDHETTTGSSFEKVVLDLLNQDISANPERLQPVTAELARRAQSLVSVEFDIPLLPEDA